jgi:hypothetical protein
VPSLYCNAHFGVYLSFLSLFSRPLVRCGYISKAQTWPLHLRFPTYGEVRFPPTQQRRSPTCAWTWTGQGHLEARFPTTGDRRFPRPGRNRASSVVSDIRQHAYRHVYAPHSKKLNAQKKAFLKAEGPHIFKHAGSPNRKDKSTSRSFVDGRGFQLRCANCRKTACTATSTKAARAL